MKQTAFALVLLVSTIFFISCSKKSEPLKENAKIIGEWKSEKLEVWRTITSSNSEGVPQWLYYSPPKDTLEYIGENLYFNTDGKIYIETKRDYNFSRNNPVVFFETTPLYRDPDNSIFKDTVNYVLENNKLTIQNGQFNRTYEVKILTENKLRLYVKDVFSTYFVEYYFFYNK